MMTSPLHHLVEVSATGPLPGLVWAYRADASATASELPPDSPLHLPGAPGWLWLHFNMAEAPACDALQSLPGLPVSAARLLTARGEPQQLHVQEGIAFGTVADLKREIDGTSDSFGMIHFMLADGILVTGRRHPQTAIEAVRHLLRGGHRIGSAEALLESVVDQAIEGFRRLAKATADEVDELEDRIIAGTTGDTRLSLGKCRRTTVRMHRHVVGLRLMFQRFDRETEQGGIPQSLVDFALRMQRRSEQIDHESVALAERARLLQEEVAALVAEETNRHLRVLSILTIIFMPPTFIAGLFGMNLKGMLFAEHDFGFWAGALTAAASSIVVVWIMRRAGILGERDTE